MNKFVSKKKILLILSLVIIFSVMLSVSYAWLTRHVGLGILTRVSKPGEISIDGVHGSNMTLLDLSYGADDIDADGNIVVSNVVCIGSSLQEFSFQIAHTTNIKGLKINIYPAKESLTKPEGDVKYKKGTSDGVDYYYIYDSSVGYTTSADTGLELMTCLNATDANKNLAWPTGAYHNDTYGTDENRVQKNAEPLYWIKDDTLKSKNLVFSDGGTLYELANAGFYVVEATWKEKEKETDLLYIITDSNQSVSTKN